MRTQDASRHIDEAMRLLTGEVYRGRELDDMKPVDGICAIVWDLQRIDCAIGPKGGSIFASIAERIQSAYVEITAARDALHDPR